MSFEMAVIAKTNIAQYHSLVYSFFQCNQLLDDVPTLFLLNLGVLLAPVKL